MFLLKNLISYVACFSSVTFLPFSLYSADHLAVLQKIEIATPFGDEENPSDLVQELLQSPAMKRLQEIDQSGVTRYTRDLPAFNRHEHSLGVYTLLKRYGLSEKECIAGLLHDISHTVFSHVGDNLFDNEEEPYHDRIHLKFLKQHGIDKILEKYGYNLNDVDASNPTYTALEQDLPNLCADRIEYTFHTAFLFGEMCSCEIDYILQELVYENGNWYFNNLETARYFADLSLYFAENFWANPFDMLGYHYCADAIRTAISNEELTIDDVLFSTDALVLAKLNSSQDPKVIALMQKCNHPSQFARLCTQEDSDLFLKAKFRGVDPLVQFEGILLPLSVLDHEFAAKRTILKNKVELGYHYKFL